MKSFALRMGEKHAECVRTIEGAADARCGLYGTVIIDPWHALVTGHWTWLGSCMRIVLVSERRRGSLLLVNIFTSVP